jgi:putative redox protein
MLEEPLPSETVQLDWISEQNFLLRDRAGFPVIMTQPMGVNGADLLPLSLIGCTAWDLIAILQKQRQQVSNLQILAESERDAEPPWRFRKIHVRYILTGSGLDPAKVQRAIELSETKYCSIHATLKPVVELTSDFEIKDDHE